MNEVNISLREAEDRLSHHFDCCDAYVRAFGLLKSIPISRDRIRRIGRSTYRVRVLGARIAGSRRHINRQLFTHIFKELRQVVEVCDQQHAILEFDLYRTRFAQLAALVREINTGKFTDLANTLHERLVRVCEMDDPVAAGQHVWVAQKLIPIGKKKDLDRLGELALGYEQIWQPRLRTVDCTSAADATDTRATAAELSEALRSQTYGGAERRRYGEKLPRLIQRNAGEVDAAEARVAPHQATVDEIVAAVRVYLQGALVATLEADLTLTTRDQMANQLALFIGHVQWPESFRLWVAAKVGAEIWSLLRPIPTTEERIDRLRAGAASPFRSFAAIGRAFADRIEELDRNGITGAVVMLTKLQKEHARLEAHLHNYRAGLEIAERTKEILRGFGGQPLEIRTADRVSLDGMDLCPNRFRQVIADSGSRILSLNRSRGNSQFVTEAIEVPLQQGEAPPWLTHLHEIQAVSRTISSLRTLDHPRVDRVAVREVGLVQVVDEMTNHLLLISTDYAMEECGKAGGILVERDGHLVLEADGVVDASEEIEHGLFPDQQPSVMIITSGNGGVYTMHKREIVRFLLEGLRVVVGDFRGYGLSEGDAGERGLKRDAEAIFRYVESLGVPQERMLFKALCMSGGVIARLSKFAPRAHFIFDQTYFDFGDVVAQCAGHEAELLVEGLRKGFDEMSGEGRGAVYKAARGFLRKAARATGRMAGAKFEVGRYLSRIRGHVGLIYVAGDHVIPVRQLRKNIEQLTEHGQRDERVHTLMMSGRHSDPWVGYVETEAAYFRRRRRELAGDQGGLDELEIEEQRGFSLDSFHYTGRIWMSRFLDSARLRQPLLMDPASREAWREVKQREVEDRIDGIRREMLAVRRLLEREPGSPLLQRELQLCREELDRLMPPHSRDAG